MAKKILLGNEAIVRASLESGVNFVSTYPGTPSSEIGNIFSQIARRHGVYFEFSTNEKTALEAAIGASFSGLKCLVAMKSFGLNVCSDSLLPFCYTGSKGPAVIIVGDDPSCWSSAQSEQNSRAYSYLAHIPMLEPSDPQECGEFTKLAFRISEKFKIPVILRTTTRVAHQRMPVEIAPIANRRSQIAKGEFVKNPHQFVTMPPRVLEMKKELLEKIEKIREFAEKSPANIIDGKVNSKKIGIITSAVSYLHVKESLAELGAELPILKLGFFYPLPEKKIKSFIKGLKRVLVAEELEPFLEKEIAGLAKEINPDIHIFGKNLLSEIGELNSQKVSFALAKILGKKYQIPKVSINLPTRYPRLCQGCPYWFIFSAIKKVAPENTIYGGDIGCYMLAGFPPHNIQDYLFSMGSSIGIGHGIKKVTNQKVIALIGDSTFFHAGIPALINAVFNKSNPLIVVLDNRTTGMTGHQTNPGIGKTGMGEQTAEIKIEEIAGACGVRYVKVLDPTASLNDFHSAIKEFLDKDEVAVIVARRMCALLAKKQGNQ